jgi:pimeloyl-ACP methyl ester carboxylesterase
MGGWSKFAHCYDKKAMAADIHELVKSLGHDKVAIAGHDIGSDVAYAYAENYPEDTDKLMRMEFPHPDDSLLYFRCCRRKALSATSWDRRTPTCCGSRSMRSGDCRRSFWRLHPA